MLPCINQATTMNSPFESDIPAYSRGGWRAVELWLTKLEDYVANHSVAEARSLLDNEGIQPVAAAFQGGLLLSQGSERAAHWEHYRRRLDLLAELGVPTLLLAPDFAAPPTADDLSQAAESLSQAAALARDRQIRLAVEFQKTARFCASLDTAVALINQAGAEGTGICFDVFHYYTGPSKFEDLGYLSADNLAHVQLSDLSGVPREMATDADRIFPGEGDLNLEPILDHFERIGYQGPVSLEVLNPNIWQIPADRVAGIAFMAMERALGHRLASESANQQASDASTQGS